MPIKKEIIENLDEKINKTDMASTWLYNNVTNGFRPLLMLFGRFAVKIGDYIIKPAPKNTSNKKQRPPKEKPDYCILQ